MGTIPLNHNVITKGKCNSNLCYFKLLYVNPAALQQQMEKDIISE